MMSRQVQVKCSGGGKHGSRELADLRDVRGHGTRSYPRADGSRVDVTKDGFEYLSSRERRRRVFSDGSEEWSRVTFDNSCWWVAADGDERVFAARCPTCSSVVIWSELEIASRVDAEVEGQADVRRVVLDIWSPLPDH